jgi:cell division septum initiation protein DivIVA
MPGSTIPVVGEYQHPGARSTSDWEELGTRIDQLERELDRYREDEQLAVKTLRSATSHAIAIRESARREAELTLRKARAEADKTKRCIEREQRDARNELLRLRQVTEQMRRGLTAFLTAKVEELRLESEEELPTSGPNEELDAALGSVVEARGSALEAPSHERAEGRLDSGRDSPNRSP